MLSAEQAALQERTESSLPKTGRPVIRSNQGVVSSGHYLTSMAGAKLLINGGNAFDALAASVFAAAVVEPIASYSLAAEAVLMLYSTEEDSFLSVSGQGTAPELATIDFYKSKGLDVIPTGVGKDAPLAFTLPGVVDSLLTMLERFGTKKISEVLEPAIKYAENGFPITELVAYYMKNASRNFKDYPNFKETYYIDDSTPYKGEIFKNPDLANTLKIIAEKGRKGFYEGKIAKTISNFIIDQGGFLSYDDLKSHKSEWIKPVSTNYRGYDIWELPPNGQGIAALQILNILENFDIKGSRSEKVGSRARLPENTCNGLSTGIRRR